MTQLEFHDKFQTDEQMFVWVNEAEKKISELEAENAKLKTKIEDIENHSGWKVCAKCEHRPVRGVCKFDNCVVKSFDWFKPKAH